MLSIKRPGKIAGPKSNPKRDLRKAYKKAVRQNRSGLGYGG